MSVENYLESSSAKESGRKPSNFGKILFYTTGGIGLGLSIICASFVAPALRKYCLPFVPATTIQVKNVLSLLPKSGIKTSTKLLDIGSGDGRIVIAAAKQGIPSDGVELNFWLVGYSMLAAFKNGVSSQTNFFRQNLWKFNLSPYNNIVIFGVEQMMTDLEKKFINEAKPGTRIIACRFPLPNLQAEKIIGSGVDTVWLYSIRAK